MLAIPALAGEACPVCQVNYLDIQQTGLMGCLYDYVHFKDDLLPVLENQHGETEHVGRRPEYLAELQGKKPPDRVRLQRAIHAASSKSDQREFIALSDSLLQLEQKHLLPGAELTASPSLDFLLSQPGEWLRGTGPEADVVLSSRIRLARNLTYYRFPSRSSQKDRADILRVLYSQVADVTRPADPCYCALHVFNPLERQLLVERQLISREHAAAEGSRGVFFDRSEKMSIMINEEDHVRIQATASGFSLEPLLTAVEDYERRIGARLSFAYDPHFGYATSSLKNTGTGLRVSVMLHLPALVLTKQIERIFRTLQKINLAVRGLYGEGSRASGDFYQISNGVTLGKSEATIVGEFDQIIPQIIPYERAARDTLLRESGAALKDRVDRAYGTLSAASLITAEEAMELLSSVRLGIHMGLIKDLTIPAINELFLQIQPAHLQKVLGAGLDGEERNLARSQFLRERLAAKRR